MVLPPSQFNGWKAHAAAVSWFGKLVGQQVQQFAGGIR